MRFQRQRLIREEGQDQKDRSPVRHRPSESCAGPECIQLGAWDVPLSQMRLAGIIPLAEQTGEAEFSE
jgi:hypothetical protein